MWIKTTNHRLVMVLMLISLTFLLMTSGCARYSRDVNNLYEPTATVKGGNGDLYIVIPENRQTKSPGIKWVLGTVTDDNNNKIDEISSLRSPEEIIQEAFSLELKKAGYNVILTTKQPATAQSVITLTKTGIILNQVSDFADLTAKCQVFISVEIFKNGQMVKRFQYETKTSRTDIKDRDLLARIVLEEALHSVMQKAMSEVHDIFKQ